MNVENTANSAPLIEDEQGHCRMVWGVPHIDLKQGSFVPSPGGIYMLDFAYGQSWVDDNGKPGTLQHLKVAKDPHYVLMPDDVYGADGISYVEEPRSPFGLTAYREMDPELQTFMGPYGLRWAHDARQGGRFPGVAVMSCGHGGYSLERLAPKDFKWADQNKGLTPVYENMLVGVRAFRDSLSQYGQRLHVRYIPWIHGAANADASYVKYSMMLKELWERMQKDVMEITGQLTAPKMLLMQPPGSQNYGAWKNLQAQVDFANKRHDVVFVGSGWGIDQHDGIHFTKYGILEAAEIMAMAARADALGNEWSAPYVRPQTVIRQGSVITGKFSTPVVYDDSVRTKRHYLSDFTSPIPFYGFEYSGCEILNANLVGQEEFRIELAEAVPGKLGFAWHGKDRRTNTKGTKRNESVNRGTLRAKRMYQPALSKRVIRLWLASFYKDL